MSPKDAFVTIDPYRMSQLWPLLEAAEERFVVATEFSRREAMISFSVGLRNLMARYGERVDIVAAKRFFGELLKVKGYPTNSIRPDDAASPPMQILFDDCTRVPDSIILELGRGFPKNSHPSAEDELDHSNQFPPAIDKDYTQSLIDGLIADTKVYESSRSVRDLLEFLSRMRHIAPFNAMLLNTQKPGLSFAATATDWALRFGRHLKPGARPLIILRAFGPVDFVFDVLDTDGEPLPDSAFSFPTHGDIPKRWFADAESILNKVAIKLIWLDEGDRRAGRIWVERESDDPKQFSAISLALNSNHPHATQFVTLIHELAHLYLGHLGADQRRKIAGRTWPDLALREVEAESVAYVVANRSGIKPRSESYLEGFQRGFNALELSVIMHAAGKIEQLLRLPLQAWPNFAKESKT